MFKQQNIGKWVIPRYWVPLFVSVKRVRPTCPSNVTLTISYLLYLIRQFAEWEAYLYGRKRANLNVYTFILPLYTMITIKFQSKKLWMWQLWMWRGRTLDGHMSHSQNSNVSTVGTPYNTNVEVQNIPDRAIWKPVVAKRNNTNPWSCPEPQILVTHDSHQLHMAKQPASRDRLE